MTDQHKTIEERQRDIVDELRADGIDRLLAEVERLRHYRDVVQRCAGADKEIARLRDENERLRAEVDRLLAVGSEQRALIARLRKVKAND